MSLLALSGTNSVSGGYDIDNSLKLESDNNEHLYRAMADGNRRTWTYSCWIKRTELLQTNSQVLIHFGVNHQVTRMFIGDTDDQLYLDVCNTENELYRSITNRKFRDTSAWYHFVWRMDTTQGTAADRMKLYINGVEETSWAQHQLPPQNYDTLANTTAGGYDDMGIGTYVWAGSNYDGLFSGYIAQVAHVDGQSYAPTKFGEFDDSGIWKPIDVSGLTYGTGNNSFFLDFEIASDLGANAKGNDVNFSLNNITSADQATDTPTNNFCTWNPLWKFATQPTTLNEGATKSYKSPGAWAGAKGTIGVSKGKWYWEHKANASSAIIGWQSDGESDINTSNAHNHISTVGIYHAGEYVWIKDSTSGRNDTNLTYTYSSSDIYGIALDLDNDTITFYQNGTAISPTAINIDGCADKTLFPLTSNYGSTTSANFGGYTAMSIASGNTDENGYGTFEYAPPSGFYALCTKNLAEYG